MMGDGNGTAQHALDSIDRLVRPRTLGSHVREYAR
jgi:hypothetical protein